MAYRDLYKELRSSFSQNELNDLCFETGFDPGDVFSPSDTATAKARKLQEYARRRGEQQMLLQAVHEMRPKVDLTPFGFEGGSGAAAEEPPAENGGSATAVSPPTGPVPFNQQKVFISYAWGGASEEFVNQLDAAFQQKGLNIVRDKRDLGYKGSITEFMRQIGQAGAIIVVINEKYLKSPNCMFELTEIAANKDFSARVFPVVLEGANIYNPVNRIKYVQHWEQQIADLDAAMKTVSSANLQGFREEIDNYQNIRNTISELTFILKDMNTLTPDMHRGGDFEVIYTEIQRRISV